jgi:hypothetical protein
MLGHPMPLAQGRLLGRCNFSGLAMLLALVFSVPSCNSGPPSNGTGRVIDLPDSANRDELRVAVLEKGHQPWRQDAALVALAALESLINDDELRIPSGDLEKARDVKSWHITLESGRGKAQWILPDGIKLEIVLENISDERNPVWIARQAQISSG